MDLISIITTNLPIITVTLGGIFLGVRKLMTMYSAEKTKNASHVGEYEIITMLREQITELAKANRELRLEIEQLRQINNSLIIENEEFKSEIRALKRYIERFIEQYSPHNPIAI